jgi:hypothetical protein
MKTIDILNLLDAFNRVYADSSLTNQEKAAIGNEVLIQLPAARFLPYKAALEVTYRSISERVAELEKPSERSAETGRSKGPKEPSKPLRKAESNA